jgi:cytochrome P450
MAHLDLMMYYAELVAEGGAGGEADLVSALKAARDGGLPMPDEEIVLACDNVVVGAAETTKQAAAGGVLAFAERPDVWATLVAREVDLARAVEEVVRWTSPALHVLRTARADGTLAGQTVRAGDPVAVWLAAANRDPAAFPDADAFVPGREPNRHLAFGVGVHFCIGAALTRLVLRVLLEELVRAVRRPVPAGSPARLRSFVTRGFSSLPLELESR